MYAQVQEGRVVTVGLPPTQPVFFGDRWWDCRDPEVRERYVLAAGWLPLVETLRPVDTATTTWEVSVDLLDGVPTQVWTERAWTADELAERSAAAEREATRTAVRAIVVDLQAEKDRAQAVIDNVNATPREKDLGRAAKRIADAAIDLARFVRDM